MLQSLQTRMNEHNLNWKAVVMTEGRKVFLMQYTISSYIQRMALIIHALLCNFVPRKEISLEDVHMGGW